MKKLLLFILCLPSIVQAEPVCRDKYHRICRSKKVLSTFRATVPCPATGLSGKRCGGYVIDHVKPLACAKDEAERAALDTVENMQWQTKADAKAKDKWERKKCGEAD